MAQKNRWIAPLFFSCLQRRDHTQVSKRGGARYLRLFRHSYLGATASRRRGFTKKDSFWGGGGGLGFFLLFFYCSYFDVYKAKIRESVSEEKKCLICLLLDSTFGVLLSHCKMCMYPGPASSLLTLKWYHPTRPFPCHHVHHVLSQKLPNATQNPM